jgi:hypothetical protein
MNCEAYRRCIGFRTPSFEGDFALLSYQRLHAACGAGSLRDMHLVKQM